MKLDEYFDQLKAGENFKRIETAIEKGELYDALIGNKPYGSIAYEPLKVEPSVIIVILHIFLSEGTITNDEINEALKRIEPNCKENVWLILMYIKAQLLYTKHRSEPEKDFGEHLVDIDLDILINKIKSVWSEYKDEYTTKHFTQKIYELAGRPVFEK